MIARPYEKGDEEMLDLVEEGDFETSLTEDSIAYSFWEDDKIKSCAGMKFIDTDAVVLWLCMDKKKPKHMFKFLREMKYVMEVAIEELGYPDLHALIKCGFENSERLAGIFGFLSSGKTMKQNGREYTMYRWLK